MSKLQLKDIVIQSEGIQLRQAILDRESKSIEEIAAGLGLSPSTFNRYMRHPKLSDTQSNAFRLRIAQKYGPVRKIIKTRDTQLLELIKKVNDSIDIYKRESDIMIFNALVELAREEGNRYCVGYAEILLSAYQFGMRHKHDAYKTIDRLIKRFAAGSENYLLMRAINEKSFFLLADDETEDALRNQRRNESNELLKGIPLDIAAMHKFYLGRFLRWDGQYNRAITELNAALKYTTDPTFCAKIYSQIGIAQMQGGAKKAPVRSFDTALEYAREAKDFDLQSMLLNNKAEYYRINGHQDKANETIKMALQLNGRVKDNRNRITAYNTYLEINEGDQELIASIITELGEANKVTNDIYIVVECINNVIDICIDNDYEEQSIRLAAALRSMTKKDIDKGLKEKLTCHYGKLLLGLQEKGVIEL